MLISVPLSVLISVHGQRVDQRTGQRVDQRTGQRVDQRTGQRVDLRARYTLRPS